MTIFLKSTIASVSLTSVSPIHLVHLKQYKFNESSKTISPEVRIRRSARQQDNADSSLRSSFHQARKHSRASSSRLVARGTSKKHELWSRLASVDRVTSDFYSVLSRPEGRGEGKAIFSGTNVARCTGMHLSWLHYYARHRRERGSHIPPRIECATAGSQRPRLCIAILAASARVLIRKSNPRRFPRAPSFYGQF